MALALVGLAPAYAGDDVWTTGAAPAFPESVDLGKVSTDGKVTATFLVPMPPEPANVYIPRTPIVKRLPDPADVYIPRANKELPEADRDKKIRP